MKYETIRIDKLFDILEDLRVDMIYDLEEDTDNINISKHDYDLIKNNVELFILKLKDKLEDEVQVWKEEK